MKGAVPVTSSYRMTLRAQMSLRESASFDDCITEDAAAADAALAAVLKVRATQIAARLALGWTPPGEPS
jgi:hypothetical protein